MKEIYEDLEKKLKTLKIKTGLVTLTVAGGVISFGLAPITNNIYQTIGGGMLAILGVKWGDEVDKEYKTTLVSYINKLQSDNREILNSITRIKNRWKSIGGGVKNLASKLNDYKKGLYVKSKQKLNIYPKYV